MYSTTVEESVSQQYRRQSVPEQLEDNYPRQSILDQISNGSMNKTFTNNHKLQTLISHRPNLLISSSPFSASSDYKQTPRQFGNTLYSGVTVGQPGVVDFVRIEELNSTKPRFDGFVRQR